MIVQARARSLSRGIPWDAAVARSEDYLPYVQEYDPVYLDFMKAYARSAGVTFDDLFALICQGEKGMCTDVMITASCSADGSILMAHTEDWLPEDEKHVVLVSATPKDGPSFLVVTLAGLELVTGLNAAGIGFSGNSLYQTDERVGTPKMCVARRILASRRIGEAVAAAAPQGRASSYNNNVCHRSGEMYCVEGSATDLSLLYPHKGFLVHTNHYIDPRMAQYEALFKGPTGTSLEWGTSSLIRHHRALTLVNRKKGQITVEALKKIVSDHLNYPDSICSHVDTSVPVSERGKTLYAVISDLTNLRMHACLGNPCEGTWQTLSLQ